MLKKFFCLIISILIFIASPGFSAEPDDDSAVIVPMPTQSNPPAVKKSVRKAPLRKPAPKKTTKKATPKKTKTTPKPQVQKKSSLEQGIALMEQERYEAAKPWLLKAIQENRNSAAAWYWYGVYHEKTGGFYQAQYFYSKAVACDPNFEPLSRVVSYPNDETKNPLWDPKRPARVYPIETNNNGITTIPPGSAQARILPSRPELDPELPKVPVYTPPEPGTSPLDGDSWRPAIYVPPSRYETPNEGTQTPVYIPPGALAVDISEEQQERSENPENTTNQVYQNQSSFPTDLIIRVDKPLYQPPEPGQQRVDASSQQTQQVQQTKKETVSNAKQTTKTQPAVPRKVVRKRNTTTQRQPARNQQNQTRQTQRPVSRDIRPAQPTQPVQPTQPEVQTQQNNSERERERERSPENMPPVGQFSPDPGTISDTPLPPVGQGNRGDS